LSGNVTGLSGKKEAQKHTSSRLILQMTLPDFPKKARQGYRTFLKTFSKVVQLFKNCPAKSSNFLKKDHQGYRTFQKLSGKVTGL
jgi:hypothetical protein